MRLQKYLNEAYSKRKSYGFDDMDEVISILQEDCKQYISDVQKYYKGNFLLTGKKDEVFFDDREVRKDRTPKDTPRDIHILMDDWFKDEFGIRFRSNSFFASFLRTVVSDYGWPYLVFPIGEYLAVSSLKIKDIYVTLEEYIFLETRKEVAELEDDWRPYRLSNNVDSIYDGIENMLDDADYKDIRKGYDEKNEVMVHCDKYYILFYDTIEREFGIDKLLQELTN